MKLQSEVTAVIVPIHKSVRWATCFPVKAMVVRLFPHFLCHKLRQEMSQSRGIWRLQVLQPLYAPPAGFWLTLSSTIAALISTWTKKHSIKLRITRVTMRDVGFVYCPEMGSLYVTRDSALHLLIFVENNFLGCRFKSTLLLLKYLLFLFYEK